MPQGIQVWNAAGVLVLDIGSRPFKSLGDVGYTGADVDQNDSGLSLGTPIFQVAAGGGDGLEPEVSVSGNILSILNNRDSDVDDVAAQIKYGYY